MSRAPPNGSASANPPHEHNLRRLRQVFGDDLLVRSGGEMIPTPRAGQLGQAVRSLLADLQTTILASAVFDPAELAEDVFDRRLAQPRDRACPEAVGVDPGSRAERPLDRALGQSRGDVAGYRCRRAGSRDRRVRGGRGPSQAPAALRGGKAICACSTRLGTGLAAPISLDDFVRVPHVTVLSTDHASRALDQG